MKKPLSLVLALVLLLSGLPTAQAAGTAAPPSWVAAEDYLTFPDDPVYGQTQWARILALRAGAEAGALLPEEGRDWADGSPGQCYETALVRLKYAANAAGDAAAVGEALLSAGKAFSAAESGWNDLSRGKDELSYRLAVEKYRAYLAYHPAYVDDWGRAIVPALDALGMTLDQFFDAPFMDRVTPETRAMVEQSADAYWSVYLPEKSRVTVYLDGQVLLMDTLPQVRNERTMVPVRAIAEALGADVEWVYETQQIVITRAGRTVLMTLGSNVALVDNKAVEMDAAPYADQNRTYIPVRYISEFFGQTVTWDQSQRRVDVTEDKSAYETADGEAWALPMGALLSFFTGGDPRTFGGWVRAPHPNAAGTALLNPRAICRETLADQWSVPDREALLDAIDAALDGEHSAQFLDSAGEVKGLSDQLIKQRTKKMDPVDQYMWPQTKALWKKWEDKGILAWDLCRSSALAQWGYTAGYLTYGEAMEFAGSAAEQLKETFSSWDQVYENFLDGYYWCIREDMTDKSVWDTELGAAYRALRGTVDLAPIFDDTLFETGVIGLPSENET